MHNLCSSTNIGTPVETCSHVSSCSFLTVHILQIGRHWTCFCTISKTGYQHGVLHYRIRARRKKHIMGHAFFPSVVVLAIGGMHKTTFIFEIAYHIFGKLVSPFTDILGTTNLKFIHPRHWCSDKMNTANGMSCYATKQQHWTGPIKQIYFTRQNEKFFMIYVLIMHFIRFS